MLIVDSQVHIWRESSPEHPWPQGRYIPEWADKPFSKDDLLDAMKGANVDRAVIVPPGFAGDRNDLALAAAVEYPDRFAVMGRLSVDDPDGPARLAEWMKQPGMLGLRLPLFTPQQLLELDEGVVDWIWPVAERAGVPLMVFPVPERLPFLGSIAKKHPGLKLVIDHMAMSHDYSKKDEKAFAHLPLLIALANSPNIAMKASGLPSHSAAPYPFKPLHEPLRRVIDAFGPQRVFWGTDLTGLPCSYSEAVTMFTEEMDWLSEEDKTWIMGRGLCEWLNWP